MRRAWLATLTVLVACFGKVDGSVAPPVTADPDASPGDSSALDAGTAGDASDAGGAPGSTTLSATQGTPRGIAVDATNVYWTNAGAGSIVKCAKAGCGGTPTVLATKQSPWGIAVDAANVYWTNRETGTVMQCAVGGCGGNPVVLATGQSWPYAIVSDGANVYWTNSGGIGDYANYPYDTPGGGQVMKCAVGGCGGAPTLLASDDHSIRSLAVDGASVYWATYDLKGHVQSCATSGCGDGGIGAAVLATTQTFVDGMAVDHGTVYWATSYRGGIFKCAGSGCAAGPTLVVRSDSARGIAIDATSVYWEILGRGVSSGEVLKCALAGCAEPTTVASQDFLAAAIPGQELDLTANLAVDDTSVYLGNTDGTVLQLAPK